MEKEDLKNFLVILSGLKPISSKQRRLISSLLKRDLMLDKVESSSDSNDNSEYIKHKQSTNVSPISALAKQHHRIGLGDTKYLDPHILQSFLRSFNQDDILKYTCHLIDADEAIKVICEECNTKEYDYAKHVEIIKKRYKDLLNNLKSQNIQLSSKMATLINVYLTGEDFKGKTTDEFGELISWSSNRISINWNSEDLKQWAKDNPHIIPNPGKNIAKNQKNSGFNLKNAIISKIDGKRIKTFSELVIFFKNQFHLRKDNSLHTILTKTNEKIEDRNNVDITFDEDKFNHSVELFTDIDKIIQAYKHIIKICQTCKEKESEPAKIELSFYDDDKSKSTFFCIHHKNTIYRKSLKSALERIGESQYRLIKNQINGLCDLYIEAMFEDGKKARINLWDQEKEMTSKLIEEEIEGVKYILKF